MGGDGLYMIGGIKGTGVSPAGTTERLGLRGRKKSDNAFILCLFLCGLGGVGGRISVPIVVCLGFVALMISSVEELRRRSAPAETTLNPQDPYKL